MAEPNFFSFLGDVPVANGRLHRRFETYDFLYSDNTMLYFLNKDKVEELAHPSPVVSNVKTGWYYPDFRFIENKKAKDVDWIIIPRENCITYKYRPLSGYTTKYFISDFYEDVLDWADVKAYFASGDSWDDESDVVFKLGQNALYAFYLNNRMDWISYIRRIGLSIDFYNDIQWGSGNFYDSYYGLEKGKLYISDSEEYDPIDWYFVYFNLNTSGSNHYAKMPCEAIVTPSNGVIFQDSHGNTLGEIARNGDMSFGYDSVSASLTVNAVSGISKTYSFSGMEMPIYYDAAPPDNIYTFYINPYDYDPSDWNVERHARYSYSYIKSATNNYIYPAKYHEDESIRPMEGETMQIRSAFDDELWEMSASSDGHTMYMTYQEESGALREVLEYDSDDDFPATGSMDKIYRRLDTGTYYEWNGSEYVVTADNGRRYISLCGYYQYGPVGASIAWFYGWHFTATYDNLTASHAVVSGTELKWTPDLYSYKNMLLEKTTGGAISELVKWEDRDEDDPDIQGSIEFNPSGVYQSNISIDYDEYTPVGIFKVLTYIKSIDTESLVINGTVHGHSYETTYDNTYIEVGASRPHHLNYYGRSNYDRQYLHTSKIFEEDNSFVMNPNAFSKLFFNGDSWSALDFAPVETTVDIEKVAEQGIECYKLAGKNLATGNIEYIDSNYDPSEYEEYSIGAYVHEFEIKYPHISYSVTNASALYYFNYGENSTVSVEFMGRSIPEADLEKECWLAVWYGIKYGDSSCFSDLYEESVEILPNGKAVLYFNETTGYPRSYLIYTENARYENVAGLYFLGNYLCMKTDNVMTFVNTSTGEVATVENELFYQPFDGWRYDGDYFYFYIVNMLGISVSADFEITTELGSARYNELEMTKLYGGTGGGFLTDKGVYLKRRLYSITGDTEALGVTGIVDGIER